MQELPWRRIDVCFKGTRMPFFAHNLIQVSLRLAGGLSPNIFTHSLQCIWLPCINGVSDAQVTRKWLNWEGEAVAQHFAALFSEMEADPRVQRALR
jgi:hypothetical protein